MKAGHGTCDECYTTGVVMVFGDPWENHYRASLCEKCLRKAATYLALPLSLRAEVDPFLPAGTVEIRGANGTRAGIVNLRAK